MSTRRITRAFPMLVYLHGLNSSSHSFKAGLLRQRLEPFPMLAPSYPAHRPEKAIQRLKSVLASLSDRQPLFVVGSSMGGFYGQFLARQFPVAHLFLINPALQPWTLLPDFI